MDIDDDLPADQQEDAGDLQLSNDWFSGPTLWSTDWTTETIISQVTRGNINLNPRFQRRNAWDGARKSLFIESLILGLPIPEIILAEERGKKGSFIVIDGKQRLITLRQFAALDGDVNYKQLRLTGLEDRPELNGTTYSKLKSDASMIEDLNNFDNQTIRTIVIRNWSEEKYLYSVFLRINTGSVQLSPQELRQALHPGPFSDFIDDYSVSSEPLRGALKIKQPDFRMRDVELVLRYFAYANLISSYNGDLKKFLDATTKHFNAQWKTAEHGVREQGASLDEALRTTRTIFGERDELRKWNGTNYEKRINRAVFDIMTFYFSKTQVRELALAKSAEIKSAFERLCMESADFRTSIESTTKSVEANRTRLGMWAGVLQNILDVEINSPL